MHNMMFSLDIIIKLMLIAFLGILIYYLINLGNRVLNPKHRIIINKNKIKKVLKTVLILMFVFFIFCRYSIFNYTLVTFIISVVIAYIINPFVNKIEKMGIKRSFSIIIVYLIVALVLMVLGWLVLPKTISEFKRLIQAFPHLVEGVSNYFEDMNKSLLKNNPYLYNIFNLLVNAVKNFIQNFQNNFFTGIPDVAMGTKTLLSGVLRLILLPVVIFYVLDDKEAIINKIKIIVPDKYEDLFSVIFREVDVALSQFVRGRILMALFVGVATMITLFLMGIEFALIIGVLTFVFDIVPYIGPFIGFVPAVLIAFFKSPIKALWVAFLFVFIQWLENNVIGPKILGSSIGLHPLVVLFSLIIGGGMFGVPGMIFAVPVIAVIKILYINILREYKINKNNKNNENKI